MLIIAACSKDETQDIDSENFGEFYGGKPFKGNAVGSRSQAGQTNYEWNGEGQVAVIETTADSTSLIIMADFGYEGEINFQVRGAYQGLNFHASDQNRKPFFLISDNRIAGEVINEDQHMIFTGSMERQRALVNVRVTFKKETNAFPAGSVLDLTIDTDRTITEGDADGDGCQMRLVPVWSPNGITMGMVPDC